METSVITDQFDRPLRDMRISVTDRCNFRCTYCMPAEVFGADYPFLKKQQLLSFEEITRIAEMAASLGVKKLRITGGEPLMRRELYRLIDKLTKIKGIEDIALTTNGVALKKEAERLRESGLKRVTVSLDSLDDQRFGQINDRGVGVKPVLEGIQAAQKAGMEVKINMMVRKGINDDEIVPMARFFRGSGNILRFIEFMDVGNSNDWKLDEVVTKKEILSLLQEVFTLEAANANYYGEVASRYKYKDTGEEIGIISSISDTFCSSCTRVRLSADGKLYTCLFATEGTDLRGPLRNGSSDRELIEIVQNTWKSRTDRYSAERTVETTALRQRKKIEMSYIGG